MNVANTSSVSDNIIVAARGVTKIYGGHVVVDNIDFDIPRGQCFGFLGPNGAGKTTTLRIALGLTPSNGGALTVFGLPIPQQARAVRARVGVVPQTDNLDPDFTIEENLQVYASYFGIPVGVARDRIKRLLRFCRLD